MSCCSVADRFIRTVIYHAVDTESQKIIGTGSREDICTDSEAFKKQRHDRQASIKKRSRLWAAKLRVAPVILPVYEHRNEGNILHYTG
jgi:hypothetical protein